MKIRCETHAQFRRMVEWAELLHLPWTYGRKLGVLLVWQ